MKRIIQVTLEYEIETDDFFSENDTDDKIAGIMENCGCVNTFVFIPIETFNVLHGCICDLVVNIKLKPLDTK